MKIVGIIPARFHSSRFPGKPLVPILGKSLIQRTYERSSLCKLFSKLLVATDDRRIFDHVAGFGAEAVMTSSHCLNGTERLIEVTRTHSDIQNADIIVNIQGDEPCIDPESIEKAIQSLQTHSADPVSTLITKIDDPDLFFAPSVVKCVVDRTGYALYFSRSPIPYQRQITIPFYKHIGLYAYRKDFLLHYASLPNTPLQLSEDLEMLKVIENGFRIRTVEVAADTIGVDIPEDIQRVENILCNM